MTQEGFKRKLTAILSADAKGYSHLMGEDEETTVRTLITYREVISTLVIDHKGRVVDSPGDNILAEFASVVDALRCAWDVQQEIKSRNTDLPENRRMNFRIGINLGDVIEEKDRIYGDEVNIAARLEGLAEEGGICISGTAYDQVKYKLPFRYEYDGEQIVKNIKEPVRVYRMRVGRDATAPMPTKKKLTSGAILVLYALIMMEGILMATPFGLLLYSFYRPFLEGVRQSVLTAWIAAFFLPQSVYATSSTLIEFIRWKGQYLFYIGLIGFFAFAIQVYWAKFKRKGMVNNFVYSYIRHPQYLFFMLSGVGLLFIWPRMMMLILFTIMSIFYFYLAKFEESRMQANHPEYLEYMKKTAMFIPGNPGGKIFKLLFGWIPNQKVAHLYAIVLVIIIIFGGAIGLRNLTIANISITKIPDKNIMAISIFPHTEQYLRDAVYKTIAYDSVQKALSEQGNVSFAAHILPSNYGMLGKFVEIHIHNRAELAESFRNRSSLRDWLWGTESDKVKVVFSKIDKPGKKFVPLNEIMDMSAKMTPVLVVDLNLATGEVINITMTSTTYYGDVPQPIF